MAKSVFAAIDVRGLGVPAALLLLLLAGAAVLFVKWRASNGNRPVSLPKQFPSDGAPSTLIEGPAPVDETGPMLTLTASGGTDIGTRENNEDQYLIRGEDGLFVVADGMGGHARGEEASLVVKEEFERLPRDVGKSWFRRAVVAANDRMRVMKTEDNERKEFGSTVVAARRQHNRLKYGWSGDSLLFRLRQGVLTCLTQEHSIPVFLARQGAIRWEDVESHPWRNKIAYFIGGTVKDPDYETGEDQMCAGDVYLLCSDGMFNFSQLAEIQAILASGKSAKEMAESLIALTQKNNARDNTTVIVVIVS